MDKDTGTGKRKKAKAASVVFVAVDYGTLTIFISVRFPDDRIELVADKYGNTPTIAAIGFEDGDPARRLIGRSAIALRKSHFEFVSTMNKRSRGKEVIHIVDNQGTPWTGEMLEVEMIRDLLQHVEEVLGVKIGGVLVTVPAVFDNDQRKSSLRIIEQAGFKCLGTINEPTAAIIGYLKNKTGFSRVGVVDIGAGTFDTTIVHMPEPNTYHVLATCGRDDLAGREFTLCLINHCRRIVEQKGTAWNSEDDPRGFALLEEVCEAAKLDLSAQDKTYITFHALGEVYDIEVTRAEFEQMSAGLLAQMREVVLEALAMGRLKASDLDAVVPVGGGSCMPAAQRMLEELFGQEKVLHDCDPFRAVCLGAAEALGMKIREAIEQGDAALEEDRPAYAIKTMETVDVCGHCLGVEAEDTRTGALVVAEVVPANTRLPFKQTRRFHLLKKDSQVYVKAEIVVLQGKAGEPAASATEIARFPLENLPPGPDTDRIEVTLALDLNGVVAVHVVDTVSGQELTGTANAASVVTRGVVS